MTVMVVGSNSFIARALRERPETANWRFVGLAEALAEDGLAGVTTLLNCAYNPLLKCGPYSVDHDIDLALARRLRPYPAARYLMLSSRMVYGPAERGGRLVESQSTRPDSLYGKAKWHTEQGLRRVLGERLTVLRLSCVCGFEWEIGRRSFFALALRSLQQEGRIVLDMSPFVERDFLPVEQLAAWLPGIVAGLRPGLFNIGAGQGTPTGRVAQWLIEGFGRGELRVSQLREHDSFWLDIRAAAQAFAIPGVTQGRLRDHCRGLGERLRQAQDRLS